MREVWHARSITRVASRNSADAPLPHALDRDARPAAHPPAARPKCHRGALAMSISTPPRQSTRLLTRRQVAERLSLSTKTIDRLIRSGALPSHHIGRSVRVSEADLAAFVAIRREA